MRNEKGFVLPIILFAMLIMTIGATVILRTSVDEAKASNAMVWSERTFVAAENALHTGILQIPDTLLPGDSAYIGSWRYGSRVYGEVGVRRIDNDSTDIVRIYLLTARGYSDQIVFAASHLEQIVTVRGRPLWDVYAGMVALGGVSKNGVSGLISGDDACGVTVPGILAPDSSVEQNGNMVDSIAPWLEGDPPLQYDDNPLALLGFGEWSEVRSMEPDYHIFNGSEWPDSSVFTRQWPVIMVENGVMLDESNSGRGVIIAPNSLRIGGGFDWDGIILVGDDLRRNGSAIVDGVVLTGLNAILGWPVNVTDLGNGTTNFHYNSCMVKAALVDLNPILTRVGWLQRSAERVKMMDDGTWQVIP